MKIQICDKKSRSALILVVVLLPILSATIVSAFLISDQGTTAKEISTGNLISLANLTISIYDNATGGNLVFEQEFIHAIVNGSWNVMINPNLEYGKRYWKDYKINGEDLDFDGNERLEMQSSVGMINNVSFINFSLINSCDAGSSIRLIYSNGSVECEIDDAGSGSINLTNYALKNQSETFEGNITTVHTGFFGWLGSLVSRITKLFVQDIDASGNVTVTGNVSASYFMGDGRFLTNVPTFNETYNNLLDQQCPPGQVVNGTLANGTFICITPALTESDPIWSANLTNGVSADLKPLTTLIQSLGNSTRRWLRLIVQDIDASGNVTVGGNVTVTGNVSASYFMGDGRFLTNVPTFNETYNNLLDQQCPPGQVVNGTLANGTFICINPAFTESDPIWSANLTNGVSADLNPLTTLIQSLGNSTRRWLRLIVQDIDASGNVTVTGNVSASYFMGDGRFLTNVPTFNETYNNLLDQQCPPGQVVNGTLANGTFICINPAFTESDPIWSANLTNGVSADLNPLTTLIQSLGNSTRRWLRLFVQDIDASGNVTVTGNVSASYFMGDGRFLTNVPTFNETYNNLLDQQCPPGQVVNGTLANGTFICINPAFTESDPIWSANLTNGVSADLNPLTTLIQSLGNSTRRWLRLIVQDIDASGNVSVGGNLSVTNNVNVGGNVTVTGNVSASYFMGDGRFLTNVPTFNETYNNLLDQQCPPGQVVNGTLANGTFICINPAFTESDPIWSANLTNGVSADLNPLTTLIQSLGNSTRRWLRLFVQDIDASGNVSVGGNLSVTNNVNVGGNVTVTGNVSASYFMGDGRFLTNVPTFNETYNNLLNQQCPPGQVVNGTLANGTFICINPAFTESDPIWSANLTNGVSADLNPLTTLIQSLGNSTRRWLRLFVQDIDASGNVSVGGNLSVTNNVNVGGNVTVTGNVSASYFMGDGRFLTNVPTFNETYNNLLDQQCPPGQVVNGTLANGTFICINPAFTESDPIWSANLTNGVSADLNPLTTLIQSLGNSTRRWLRLIVQDIDASGNVTVTGNVSASYFMGDGRFLTNVPTFNETYNNLLDQQCPPGQVVNGTLANGTFICINPAFTESDPIWSANLTNGVSADLNPLTTLIQSLGNSTRRWLRLFVQDIDASGNVTVTGNVSASYFMGDGRFLTNVPTFNETYNNLLDQQCPPGQVVNGTLANGTFICINPAFTESDPIWSANLTNGVSADLNPLTTLIQSLGNSTRRWLRLIVQDIDASGNVSVGGNLSVTNNVNVGGNVTVTGNVSASYFMGDGRFLTNVPTFNETYNNLLDQQCPPGQVVNGTLANGTFICINPAFTESDPIWSANLTNGVSADLNPLTTLIQSLGNSTRRWLRLFVQDIDASGNVSVGGNLSVTNNVNVGGNVTVTGNVSASYFMGDGRFLTNVPTFNETYNNLLDQQCPPGQVVNGTLANGTFICINPAFTESDPIWSANLTNGVSADLNPLTTLIQSLGNSTRRWLRLFVQDIDASGNVSVGGNLSVTNNVNVGGNVTVTGNVSASYFMGDGRFLTNVPTFNETYNNLLNQQCPPGQVVNGTLANGTFICINPAFTESDPIWSANLTNGVSADLKPLATGFIQSLGNSTRRWLRLFVQDINASGNVNVGGNVTVTGNVSASYFMGDGRFLTNVPTFNETYNNLLDQQCPPGQVVNGTLANGTFICINPAFTESDPIWSANLTNGVSADLKPLATGFIQSLGNSTRRWLRLFVQDINASGNVNVGGNVTVTGNVSASYFMGDGRFLTNVPTFNETYNNLLDQQCPPGQVVNGTLANGTFICINPAFTESDPIWSANLTNGVSADLNPLTTLIQSLGNSTRRWLRLFVQDIDASGNVSVGGNLSVTNNVNVGGNVTVTGNVSASYFMGDGRFLTNVPTFNETYNNLLDQQCPPGQVVNGTLANGTFICINPAFTESDPIWSANLTNGVSADLNPLTTLIQSLGNSTRRWLRLFVQDIDASGNVSVGGNLSVTNNVNVGGNVTVTGNVSASYFMGDGRFLTNVPTFNETYNNLLNQQCPPGQVVNGTLANGTFICINPAFTESDPIWSANLTNGVSADLKPLATGFIQSLGNSTRRWLRLFVQDINASGNVNVGGNVTVTGNVSASYFMGDGRFLTNVPTFNETYNNLLDQQCPPGQVVNGTLANGTFICINPAFTESDPIWSANLTNGVSADLKPLATGFIQSLGNSTRRWLRLFVQDINASGNVNVGGNVTVTGNVSASYFMGDGRFLTNVPTFNETYNNLLDQQCPPGQVVNGTLANGTFICINPAFTESDPIWSANLTNGVSADLKPLATGFIQSLGNSTRRWLRLFVQDINASGNVNVGGNVSAQFYFGSLNTSTFPTSSCSGTDKARGIHANGTVICDTDQTGNGGGSAPSPWKISQEFLTASASVFDPFLGAAISSGTVTAQSGTATRPGIVRLSDSTTANGAYRIMTDTITFLIGGNETATFLFRHQSGRTTSSYRMGFQDSTAIQTAPTDGCYFEVNSTISSNNSLTGRCRNNGAQTITATTFDLTATTWYKGTITIDSEATSVNFTLYDETNSILWSDVVTSNIPTASGRQTGFGIIAGETTTDTGAAIVDIDYMELIINRTELIR